MSRAFHRLSFLVIALAAIACAPAPPDTSADVDAINAIRRDFAGAVNDGDAARLNGLYAPDAIFMRENRPSASGRASILAAHKEVFSANVASMTLNVDETKVFGNRALDRGQYTLDLTPKTAGSPNVMQHGKYLLLLQKQQDGAWKITHEISNQNMAPMVR